MNIFATSQCPISSAQALDDKRVVKMCLETAQLLSGAITLNGGVATYKLSHKHHPAMKWAAMSRDNYVWLLWHFKALLTEYKKLSGKVHACSKLLNEFDKGIEFLPKGELTPFVNCTENKTKGISYKYVIDVHEAYRLYLKSRIATDVRESSWKNRQKPDWL